MNILTESNYKILTPDNGKQLSNGEVYSLCVYLPLDGDTNAWSEVSAPANSPIELSRDLLFKWASAHGLADVIQTALSGNSEAAKWFFGKCDYVEGSSLANYLQNLLGLSDNDMTALVDECRI